MTITPPNNSMYSAAPCPFSSFKKFMILLTSLVTILLFDIVRI
ncbi:hypothetical protein J2743_001092 [Methanobacterium petrolearium]|nr:hypothetical protein [Methanobacterium petrolearium]